MNDFPRKITKTLLQIIETMESERSKHVKNPGIDFSRKRKMDFKSLILFMLVMEGNTVTVQILRKRYRQNVENFEPTTASSFEHLACCQAAVDNRRSAFNN